MDKIIRGSNREKNTMHLVVCSLQKTRCSSLNRLLDRATINASLVFASCISFTRVSMSKLIVGTCFDRRNTQLAARCFKIVCFSREEQCELTLERSIEESANIIPQFSMSRSK